MKLPDSYLLRLALLSAALACLGSSCTIHPFVVTSANGTQTASLGGSLATKSSSTSASITMTNGTVIKYSTKDHDETVVPKAYIGAGVTKALATEVGGLGSKAVDKIGN
jgi:hypothetical protein